MHIKIIYKEYKGQKLLTDMLNIRRKFYKFMPERNFGFKIRFESHRAQASRTHGNQK